MVSKLMKYADFRLPARVSRRLALEWRCQIMAPASAAMARQLSRVRSSEVRGAMFDAAPSGSVLVANTGQEVFAVLRDDEVIARSMYATGVPFDFDNMRRAYSLVEKTHAPTRLIDIGANLGSIAIAAVKRGLFQRADAIEPEPRNFRLLTANVYLNALEDRITCHQVALGDQDNTTLQFVLSDGNFGDHRVSTTVVADSSCTESTISVAARRLDTLFPDLQSETTMLWMDVQGYEGHVLAGSPRILAGCPPLVLEFTPASLSATNGYRLLREAVLKARYQQFFVLKDTGISPTPLTGDALDALQQSLDATDEFVDLLFT